MRGVLQMSQTVSPTQNCFRPNTRIPQTRLSLVLSGEGLGGYVCYVRALQWVAENCPHLKIQIFVPVFFFELAKHWLSPYGWEVYFHDDIKTKYKKDDPAMAPDFPVRDQLYNALGGHPLDIGFSYYANMSGPPPDYNNYPALNFPESALPASVFGKDYAVLTPGSTAANRTLSSEQWNFLISEVISRGLTPVFLGKSDLTLKYGGSFPADIAYDKGIDLRNQTSPLEAAAIMQHARFTLGLDNGLLHLASCTPGNVIFAYNVASPEHRMPRRRAGQRTENIFLTPAELSCIHCQSRMKLLIGHDFKQCLYKDKLCLDLLFADDGARWKRAITNIMEKKSE